MFHLILSVHLLLCVFLVGLVLIQQGRGADMGAAFGGSSNTLFGAGGAADFLTKMTTGTAIAFMVSSILLVRWYDAAVTTPRQAASPLEGSVMQGEARPAPAAKDDAASVPGEQQPAAAKADAPKSPSSGAAAPAPAPAAAPAPPVQPQAPGQSKPSAQKAP